MINWEKELVNLYPITNDYFCRFFGTKNLFALKHTENYNVFDIKTYLSLLKFLNEREIECSIFSKSFYNGNDYCYATMHFLQVYEQKDIKLLKGMIKESKVTEKSKFFELEK